MGQVEHVRVGWLSGSVPLLVAIVVVTLTAQQAAVAAVTPGRVDGVVVGTAVSSESHRAAGGGSGHAVEAVDATASPDDLVAELQTLLSHQATLTSRLTRATLTGDPRFVEAADNALVRSIADLRRALTPVVGARAARRVSSRWERRTQALFQYATGIRDDAPEVRRTVRRQLDRGIEAQATALSDRSNGRVGPTTSICSWTTRSPSWRRTRPPSGPSVQGSAGWRGGSARTWRPRRRGVSTPMQ